MSTFVVRKKISLSFLGDGWADAYVEFSPFSFSDNDRIIELRKYRIDQMTENSKEAKKASDDLMAIIKDKFIAGKGYDGKELIDITKDNLNDLPMEVILKVLAELQGAGVIPKNE